MVFGFFCAGSIQALSTSRTKRLYLLTRRVAVRYGVVGVDLNSLCFSRRRLLIEYRLQAKTIHDRPSGHSAREFFARAKECRLAFALVGPLTNPQLQLLLLGTGFRRLVRLLGKGYSGETGDRYQLDECFHGMV